jgi:transposase InsO family protein
MHSELTEETIPLPKNWSHSVRHSLLRVFGLVRMSMLAGREYLIRKGLNSTAHIQRLETEVALLREESRILSSRMKRVPSQRRPQYSPIERMAILELRALRGWNQTETVRHFLISDDTIRSWLRRADDDSLLQTNSPVNRFPEFVRYTVQQIKLFCPGLGKVKIAETLARAGVHLGKTTVERILQEKPIKAPESTVEETSTCEIVSKYPNHTWHADLTAVPISGGFWTIWIPNSLSPRWPVCWWQLHVVDHYSRRAMGFATFKTIPTSKEVTTALDQIIVQSQAKPKHIIVDKGSQFDCDNFTNVWCDKHSISYRFGAVGKHGSIAVVERFHRTIKDLLRQTIIPEKQSAFEKEVVLTIDWYNEHRPHTTLKGKTPNEVYYFRPAANEQPRFEPREQWPIDSPCAKPQVEVRGSPGDPIILKIDGYEGRRHLPIIQSRLAA